MYDRAGRWKFCVQLLSVVGKVTDPTVTSHSNILLVLQSKEVTVPLYNQSFFSSQQLLRYIYNISTSNCNGTTTITMGNRLKVASYFNK